MNYFAGTEEDSGDLMSILQQPFHNRKELDKMTLGSNIMDDENMGSSTEFNGTDYCHYGDKDMKWR